MATFSVIHIHDSQILNRISITYDLYQKEFFLSVYLSLKFGENCNQSSAAIFNRNAEARWVSLQKLKYAGDWVFLEFGAGLWNRSRKQTFFQICGILPNFSEVRTIWAVYSFARLHSPILNKKCPLWICMSHSCRLRLLRVRGDLITL